MTTFASRKATHASIEGTLTGYRVTVYRGSVKLFSTHIAAEFEVMGGVPVSSGAQLDAAYAAAKKVCYAAGVA